MSDESRVNMVWPTELKEAVRTHVGGRGLTEFTVEAVRAKLDLHDEHKADLKELNAVKDLAQRLADALALGGDYENRRSQLQEIDLPDWVDTTGWPEDRASVVKIEDSSPEPVIAPGPVADDEDLHKPMFMVKSKDEGPAVGDPGTIRKADELPVVKKNGDDLWQRIQAKAREKGVDLSDVPMKKASDVEAPPPDPTHGRIDPDIQRDVEEMEPADIGQRVAMENAAQAQREAKEAKAERRVARKAAKEKAAAEAALIEAESVPAVSNPCPKCGAELVGNECWECFG